ncbi:TetR/AcrR family transcriptional regulator [Cellulomonas sp. ATA003]|uniref:TetR/AcrR family transcriptional regulator n=1 Tax=Cellulomonas sp. ATA003 TaxID=3073064 RepID=UPI002873E6B9|nr:TetR/AcrR family transcriptional regulator [Cellulomonas sp. ATA003]WNB85723.1 TetR/AcrR family transcriptional regulator [Cellulomonas sp. ATA003]
MTAAPDLTDRRAALKARHRRAIVAAAESLIAETGGLGFTIDDLARRADISRRTVFNHFASIDDIVTEVFSDTLGAIVDSLERIDPAGDDPASLLDELAQALRATDLVTPMAYLTRSLRSQDDRSPQFAVALVRVLGQVGDRLATAMVARHPRADLLDVHLLVNAVISGLVVLHQHWDAATGACDDDDARQVWARLVDRLVENTRHGYGRMP